MDLVVATQMWLPQVTCMVTTHTCFTNKGKQGWTRTDPLSFAYQHKDLWPSLIMVHLQQFTSFCLSLLPFEVTINKFHTKHYSENMDLQHNFCIIMQRQKDYKMVARFPKIFFKKGGFVNRVVWAMVKASTWNNSHHFL